MTDPHYPNLKPFARGQSGNPKGRPRGARSKLGEKFLEDLLEDWKANGSAVIVKVREDKPDQYLRVVASVIPREVDLEVAGSGRVEDMTDAQLIAIIRRLDDDLENAGIDLHAEEITH
ncbi:MAG TPA: DUF5681 domain-containing protein [Devosia sp.]|nr:DUF5681 domain-containing protein [Devosia sp.]